MLRLDAGSCTVLIRDEPAYTPRSADNLRRYDREVVLGDARGGAVGVEVHRGGACVRSVVLLTWTGVPAADEARAFVRGDLLMLALGPYVNALAIPGLEPRWETQADMACVFALHPLAGSDDLIVHGELAISRLGPGGVVRWSQCGRDILTGALQIGEDVAEVTDWNGDLYRFRLTDGHALASPAHA